MAKFKEQLTTGTLQTAGKIALATTAAGAALLVEYKLVQKAVNALTPSEAKKLAAKQKWEMDEFYKTLKAPLQTLEGMRE